MYSTDIKMGVFKESWHAALQQDKALFLKNAFRCSMANMITIAGAPKTKDVVRKVLNGLDRKG